MKKYIALLSILFTTVGISAGARWYGQEKSNNNVDLDPSKSRTTSYFENIITNPEIDNLGHFALSELRFNPESDESFSKLLIASQELDTEVRNVDISYICEDPSYGITQNLILPERSQSCEAAGRELTGINVYSTFNSQLSSEGEEALSALVDSYGLENIDAVSPIRCQVFDGANLNLDEEIENDGSTIDLTDGNGTELLYAIDQPGPYGTTKVNETITDPAIVSAFTNELHDICSDPQTSDFLAMSSFR